MKIYIVYTVNRTYLGALSAGYAFVVIYDRKIFNESNSPLRTGPDTLSASDTTV
jgi:hypothetical protein